MSLCGCYSTNKNYANEVDKIYLKLNFPIIIDGKLRDLPDSICIFTYKNLILYQLPNYYSESVVSIKKHPTEEKEDQINEKITLSEIRYNYFFYEKNKQYGYIYDSTRDKNWEKVLYNPIDRKKWKKVSVDSLLAVRSLGDFKFSNLTDNTIFIDSLKDQNTNSIQYIYVPKIAREDGDSLYLYYSDELKNMEYSFSKEMDNIKKSKLYKIRIICNEKYSPTYKVVLPKREFIFEIGPLPLNDSKLIKRFFEQCRKTLSDKLF